MKSRRRKPRINHYNNFDDQSDRHKRLVSAVIEQAVKDYLYYVSVGLAFNLQPIDSAWSTQTTLKKCTVKYASERGKATRYVLTLINGVEIVLHGKDQNISRAAIERVCHFLKQNGGMDQWIDIAELPIAGCQIRKKLTQLQYEKETHNT
jgi:hypothetical protein